MSGALRDKVVLVTGAAGYVGAALCRALEHDGARVIAWTRADGDLASDDAFASMAPHARDITHVVHAAAVTRFNVEADLADRVNTDGARRAFAFAARCPNLEHLTYVSTVYTAGLRTGRVPEQPLDAPPRFANHYERSKWQAEQALLGDFAHLPATIARVATVIADDAGGAVTQRNAVHNTLQLLFHGLLSLVPGDAATPLCFVTGDLVVDALAALVRGAQRPRVVHLAHGETATLGELLDVTYDVFERDPSYQKRRLLRPLYVDHDSFELLVSGIDGFGGDAVRQALLSVAPFARQLFSPKDVATDGLRALLPAHRAPDPRALIRATVEHLIATRWGRATAAARRAA